MSFAKSPLLITNAVNAATKTDTALIDPQKRASLAKTAVYKIIDSKKFERIVIADGSNHILLSEEECFAASKLGIEIEQLAFKQNSDDVAKFGKGHGEMQIVEYAYNNSRIFSKESCFYKLSGRYFLSNFEKILEVTERHPSVFFNYNPSFCLTNSQFTCSAFYKCSFYAYEKFLRHAIDGCTLQREGRLESAFLKALKKAGRSAISSSFPKFEGIGGTLAMPIDNKFFWARNFYSNVGGLAFTLIDDSK